MTAIDLRAVLDDLKRRIDELQTAHDVIARLIPDEAEAPAAAPKKPKPPAKSAAPSKANAKRSRYAGDVARIRKLGHENYELNPHQLKERFNLAPSGKMIRQILRGKVYADPEYDPKEWIELNSNRKA